MHSVSDVMEDLIGNGYTETEILEISGELTSFTISREKLFAKLSEAYDEDELKEILMTIEGVSFHQQIMAKLFEVLTPIEKERYLLHTVDNRSLASIAKEQGVSKGAVQLSITRTREKIEMLKLGRTFVKKGNVVHFLPEKE